jgi:hypothetical protein
MTIDKLFVLSGESIGRGGLYQFCGVGRFDAEPCKALVKLCRCVFCIAQRERERESQHLPLSRAIETSRPDSDEVGHECSYNYPM